MSFVAQYPGSCAQCELEIKGTEVVYNSSGELEHRHCPGGVDDATPGRNERMCGECFTIHAGECP